jgi:hypothetical protein
MASGISKPVKPAFFAAFSSVYRGSSRPNDLTNLVTKPFSTSNVSVANTVPTRAFCLIIA